MGRDEKYLEKTFFFLIEIRSQHRLGALGRLFCTNLDLVILGGNKTSSMVQNIHDSKEKSTDTVCVENHTVPCLNEKMVSKSSRRSSRIEKMCQGLHLILVVMVETV